MCIFSSVLEGSVIWVICPTQSLVPILPHSTLSHSSWHPHLAHHLWAPGLGLWSKWPGWTLVLPLTFLYSSWDSHGKYTGVVCHSLLQWITFCQNSPLGPVCLGWPCTVWFIASLSYTNPFATTRQWSMKGDPMLWPPMWMADSLGKTLMLGKVKRRRRRGWQRMRWLDDITNSMYMNLGKLQEMDGVV